jgi:hypothetical protein
MKGFYGMKFFAYEPTGFSARPASWHGGQSVSLYFVFYIYESNSAK